METELKTIFQKIQTGQISSETAVSELKVLKAAFQKSQRFLQNKRWDYSPSEGIRQSIVKSVADILMVKVEDIPCDAPWYELGMDKVSLAAFSQTLFHRHQIEISVEKLVDCLTINDVFHYLHNISEKKFVEKNSSSICQERKEQDVPIITKYVEESLLHEKLIDYIKNLVSTVSKLPVEQIGSDIPLERYGINSVMVIQLTEMLERIFGRLSKTLFFEYQTIRALSEYFFTSYRSHLNSYFSIGSEITTLKARVTSAPSVIEQSMNSKNKKKSRRRKSIFSDEELKSNNNHQRIAIIGLAGRYPGASTLPKFWENLKAGKDCITEIPKDRWDHSRYYDPDKDKAGKVYSKWGGFIDGVDKFDPLFFAISPREAVKIDPQERLFLQCVYETLEDAGYTRETLQQQNSLGRLHPGGKVGVFVGVMYEEYQLLGAQETTLGRPLALSGNPSSIANRVSYFFNFNGPSMAVDTMCSSSLTAIHLACQSLMLGECLYAIAGGVNISIHPNKYMGLSQGKFISSKGRCESFGQGGDGYVPGEGVGAVLLKPLSLAIADGDQIYGVIRSSAVNHGGKTNGYTVPNPNAQAELIINAIEAGDVDPRIISYIEAHGTGTSLGDPIEITGLSKAFNKFIRNNQALPRQYCAIGSVKSNIGHLESAAGIAGLTKVLLQMKNGYLVPSLHAGTLNPNIDFEDSPFQVQRDYTPWNRPALQMNGELIEYPRIAGISAFGAGGSNAHLIVEEYLPQEAIRSNYALTEGEHVLFVFSAKNSERLHELACRWLEVLKAGCFTSKDLADMAFTLQIGREHMETRMAITASTIQELIDKLQSFASEKSATGLYLGQANLSGGKLSVFDEDDDLQQTVEAWITKKKYQKLAELWVQGLTIDWVKLYGESLPRRISLPTYPFAKQRYWAAEVYSGIESLNTATEHKLKIHPLIHVNTSDESGIHFTSNFTDDDFFLKDHVFNGQPMLPGAAYLEMARAAVVEYMEKGGIHPRGICLENVVWMVPLVVYDESIPVRIYLSPKNNDRIDFEIHSFSQRKNETIQHCQGRIVLEAFDISPCFDLSALKKDCGETEILPSSIYQEFKKMGIEYGSAHQGISAINKGKNALLAQLHLPDSLVDTKDQFVLHPSIMDAAWQSVMALDFSENESTISKNAQPAFPFALERLEIYHPCNLSLWAYIRLEEEPCYSDNHKKICIDLLDDSGSIHAKMSGFTIRIQSDKKDQEGFLYLEPVWETVKTNERLSSIPLGAEHHVIFVDIENIDCQQIQTHSKNCRCYDLKPLASTSDARFSYVISALVKEIQQIVEDKPKGNVLFQVVIPAGNEKSQYSGLSGLMKTVRREYPQILTQLIQIEPNMDSARIFAVIRENSLCLQDEYIKYQNNLRQVIHYKEIPSINNTKIPWKDHGVYLITGGMGGLGFLFAEEIIRQTKKVTLILTGRSTLNPEKSACLESLNVSGSTAVYRSVDVSQQVTVKELIQSIVDEYGCLSGIIHSAGVTNDSFIARKTTEELALVLAPKVAGLVNLDVATNDIPLDFILLFSSISGAFGNPGQGDYAAANAFMDSYAGYRQSLVDAGKRYGQTLSINWPLWKEGGMKVNTSLEAMIYQKTGMRSLESNTGVDALYRSMALHKNQVVILSGNVAKLKQTFLGQPVSTVDQGLMNSASIYLKQPLESNTLLENIRKKLFVVAGGILAINPDEISGDAEFYDYGFDSVTLTEFSNKLNREFDLNLSPTIFFEHTTLNRFSAYLFDTSKANFISLEDSSRKIDVSINHNPLVEQKTLNTRFTQPFEIKTKRESLPNQTKSNDTAIAIVGMSGRFPMARDLTEYWQNLLDGKDCIQEIPLERLGWWGRNNDVDSDEAFVKWGGFIEGVDEFDPLFFGISPREALLMDPQQRLLMMYVWKAFEDAGYSPSSLNGTNTGIFVATTGSGYSDIVARHGNAGESYSATGSVPSIGPNRMSYLLNLHGPSEPIETACSSSLVAIHRAVTAMAMGDCDMAIAGGINTLLAPETHISFSKAGMLSKDGRCKTFSGSADGYVRGEGVGMLFLKRLKDAEAAGDSIYAVIRGSAVNHGGKAGSLTAPNPTAQANLLKQAYSRAGIDSSTVGYIEAHGTGTELGDPIEIDALKRAYQELCPYEKNGIAHCGIGSVKSNIGHLELAAGIAGVIKVLLQLQNKTLVKTLHCNDVNPYIHLEESPFYIVREVQLWQPVKDISGIDLPRRAGVSSFGFGGVNAHIILEEYKPSVNVVINQSRNTNIPSVIVLSAKNEEQLKEQAKNLLDTIQRENLSDANLHDLAYTLQVGRDAMPARISFLSNTINEVTNTLLQFLENGKADSLFYGEVKSSLKLPQDTPTISKNLIAKGEYSKLTELWVKGINIDWLSLHQKPLPSRIHLPSYPFARDKYWISDKKSYIEKANTASIVSTVVMPKKVISAISIPKEQSSPMVSTDCLKEKITHQLKVLFAEVIQLDPARIDADMPLEIYGIDSLMITMLNQRLEEIFGDISKTLFYEYQTLNALSGFFIAAKPDECSRWVGINLSSAKSKDSAQNEIQEAISIQKVLQVPASAVAINYSLNREPIAVIGMAGRYPQADNLKTFWTNLAEGKNCITEIPADRWPLDDFFYPDLNEARTKGKSYCKWGGFLNGFADFDPLFFRITPLEAMSMDPQERLFLQTCWELFEEAGYTRQQLSNRHGGRVGVFVGITQTGFGLYGPELWKKGDFSYPRTAFGSVANRVSYIFNLNGPSMPIDTMCSSSLTAIHEACEHLYRGECEMAIAGGVNLYLHPISYIALSSQGMLSKDGQCRSFGEGANGFVPGEGVGALLLKPFSKAKANGDHIHAVILGSHINHDGKTNGFTVPNPNIQAELIASAMEKSGVNARSVSYIEAHGTGTELGDPIEITGLTQAFRKFTDDTRFCSIGSVKSNIGHLEAAAGIAGITKIILQMKYGKIAPSLHSQEKNPNINFYKTPFTVQQTLEEWPLPKITINGEEHEYPRIAGISSFGAGGANAHVIIQEYMEEEKISQKPVSISTLPTIIVLSARREDQRKEQVSQLLASISGIPVSESNLTDIAYTLQTGREAMDVRFAVVAESLLVLKEKLQQFISGKKGIADLYIGNSETGKQYLQMLSGDEDTADIAERWIRTGQIAKFLSLWVNGFPFDWNRLYKDFIPKKISLPAYPFAKERYWISSLASDGNHTKELHTDFSFIHPLLYENQSDCSGQRFVTRFTGKEFYLSDHTVNGKHILPGVVYLEMARAAAEYSIGNLKKDSYAIRLQDIVWVRPLIVDDHPKNIQITIVPEISERFAYTIQSIYDTDDSEPLLLSQGNAVITPNELVPALNLIEIKERCCGSIISSDALYKSFVNYGLEYGAGFQAVNTVHIGHNEVLGRTLYSGICRRYF